MTNVALLRLRDDVIAASTIVAPTWPLSSAVAVNPLQGFERLPLAEALQRAEELFGARGTLELEQYRELHRAGAIGDQHLRAAVAAAVPADEVDEVIADLLHGPADPPAARTVLTVAEEHDRRWGTRLRDQVDAASAERCLHRYGHDGPSPTPDPDADQVLLDALDHLRVPAWAQRRYLEASVAALPGWVGHLRWREQRESLAEGALVLDALAHRVATEAEVVGDRSWFHADGPLPRPVDVSRRLLWLAAHELAVHDAMLASLPGATTGLAAPDGPRRPATQFVACIDVRSEPLRRHLEAVGDHETFGYAGFFGIPVHVRPAGGGPGSDRLPVLLSAQVAVEDRATADAAHRVDAGAQDAWYSAKVHPMAPLALAEGAGWVAGPLAAARTFAPASTARALDRVRPKRSTSCDDLDRSELTIEAQAAWIGAILGLLRTGESEATARLVVLCGHGSRTDNNPFESALACGACGGHPGGTNARLAAAAANDPAVRAALAEAGAPIAADTWFVAAEHDTATDTVALLDVDAVPASHADDVSSLVADLDEAGRRAAIERAPSLPGARTDGPKERVLARTRRRGRDWAEPAAELGLAGNAAFIVGPRSLTAGVDLGRRAFLHSYDAELDADGSGVHAILTAPLIVAQWINACYHFAATDPHVLGAGSKAFHNVVADIGVLSSGGGDLRRGLPLQSVRAGDRLLHEPVRLLAVVQARLDHIDAALEASPTLRQLVEHEWIHLVARESAIEPWRQRGASGWRARPLTEPNRAPDLEATA